MKAYDFQYGEHFLHEFGMIICNFGGSKGLETISNGSAITFNTVSTLNGSKHESTSAVYEECLETTIQICKNTCSGSTSEILPHEFRELTRWLNRKKFLKFKILDEHYQDLYCEASFNISRIEFNGSLVGLELEVKTNRPFFLKEPVSIKVKTKKLYTWEKYEKTDNDEKGVSTGKYATSYDRGAYPDDGVKIYSDIDIDADTEIDVKSTHYYVFTKEENVTSIFDSSHEEGYIYPHTEITVLEDGDLEICNTLENRKTCIDDCKSGEVITMDYPIIQTDNSEHDILNDFDYNFFRIANTYENRRNNIVTSLPCIIKVEYSPIVKVGL